MISIRCYYLVSTVITCKTFLFTYLIKTQYFADMENINFDGAIQPWWLGGRACGLITVEPWGFVCWEEKGEGGFCSVYKW